jgi:hypothetical protein
MRVDLYGGPVHDVADKEMTVIHDLSEIPRFATEDDEAAYWDTHTRATPLEAGTRP